MEPTPQPGWDELEPLLRAAKSDDAARGRLAALLHPVLADWALQQFGPGRGDLSSSDVAQEVLVKALASLTAFKGANGAASFWAWLRTILVNHISNQFRGTNRTVADVDGLDLSTGDPSPSACAAVAERKQRVIAALHRLAPGDRELVVGRYFHEKPPAKLAAEQGLSEGIVNDRLKRAKKELRDLLGGDA